MRSGVFPVFVVRLSIPLLEEVTWSEGSRLGDRYRSVCFSGLCGDGMRGRSGLFSCGRTGSDHVGFDQVLVARLSSALSESFFLFRGSCILDLVLGRVDRGVAS